MNPKFTKVAEDYAFTKLKTRSLDLTPLADTTTKDGDFILMAASNTDLPNSESISFALNEDGKVFTEEELGKTYKRNIFIPEKLGIILPRFDKPTISPNLNDLVLNLCDKFGERLTVHIPKNPSRDVDIYFLADTTGSMGASLNTVKTNIATIISSLSGIAGVNMAFGAGNYRDFPTDPFCFQHNSSISPVVANVTAGIAAWALGGGADSPEGQMFAFTKIADPANPVGWRPNSLKILVWFGDAPGHDPICPSLSAQVTSPITEISATNLLKSAKIRVLGISIVGGAGGLNADPNISSTNYTPLGCIPAGNAGQATRITAATSGSLQIGVNPTDIANAIINMIQTSVSKIQNVSLVPTGTITPFICSINPKNGYNNLDAFLQHNLEFIVCFRGVEQCKKERDQRFKGSIDAVMDGVVVAKKVVLIEVPACKSKGKCQCDCCD